ARPPPPHAPRRGRRPARAGAVRLPAGARRAAGGRRGGAAATAGRAARGGGAEDLGRAVVPAGRGGPGRAGEHGRVALPLRPGPAARPTDRGGSPVTDDFDALEAELRSLSPCPPSPGLRRRIAERLTDAAPAPRPIHRYA